MTDQKVTSTTTLPELTPIEKLKEEHEAFIEACKQYRTSVKMPKYAQGNVEDQLAKKYSRVKIKGYWVKFDAEKKNDGGYILYIDKEKLKALEITEKESKQYLPKI